MNSRVETVVLPAETTQTETSFPAGAGVALAVILGSLIWVGFFVLVL